jgi:hypothetical protein
MILLDAQAVRKKNKATLIKSGVRLNGLALIYPPQKGLLC